MPKPRKVQSYLYMYRQPDIFDGTIYRQSWTDTTSGSNNPGWRDKVKSGLNAATPYSCDRLQIHKLETFCRAQLKTGIRQSPGGPIVGTSLLDLSGVLGSLDLTDVTTEVGSYNSAQAEAQALNRVYKKIRQEYESASGLEFLGEMRETIKQIRRPADAIRSAFFKMHSSMETADGIARRLKRKRSETDAGYRKRQLQVRYKTFLGVPRMVSGAVAGSLLEVNFGWRPLFKGCKDLVDAAIEAIINPTAPRLRVVGTSDDYVASFTNSNPMVSYQRLRAQCLVSRVTNRSVRYVVGLQPRISAPLGSLELLSQRMGLGLNAVIPTLWELCPYSVFADYFVNIGDILGAACTSTSSVQWQTRTERVRTDGVESYHSVRPQPDDSLNTTLAFASTETMGMLQTTRTRLVRTVPSSLPLPPLVFSIPGEGSNAWYNLSAFAELQRQRFSKPFK